jgi:molybdate transport system substrate-binding protein
VLSAGAVKYAVTDFAHKFTGETGAEVAFTFGTIGQVKKRLAGGETTDVIIGTAPAIAELAQAGVLLADSRADLGRTFTSVCVREGAPMPDISTPEQFRQAMLAARSLAYTDPQAGGTSGIFLVGLFARLGIADAMRAKALTCSNGDEVVDKVLAGEAELGSTFLSEIVPVKGVRSAGALPPPIENVTAYAAGVMTGSANAEAAARFIAILAAAGQRDAWRSFGFEPRRQG